jgi:hypothetical protein
VLNLAHKKSEFNKTKTSKTENIKTNPKIQNENARNRRKKPSCNESIESFKKRVAFKRNYKIEIDLKEYELEELSNRFKKYSLQNGTWKPKNCETKHNVAIVIPYRDRLSNLKLFLSNMHQFFMDQYLSYTIYLIEPLEKLVFNRGILMNIGFLEALKDGNNKADCFFFHDADMIAEDRRIIYECDPNYPSHFAVAVSKNNYSLDEYLHSF